MGRRRPGADTHKADIRLMVGSASRDHLPNLTILGPPAPLAQPLRGLESRRMSRQDAEDHRSNTRLADKEPDPEPERAGPASPCGCSGHRLRANSGSLGECAGAKPTLPRGKEQNSRPEVRTQEGWPWFGCLLVTMGRLPNDNSADSMPRCTTDCVCTAYN